MIEIKDKQQETIVFVPSNFGVIGQILTISMSNKATNTTLVVPISEYTQNQFGLNLTIDTTTVPDGTYEYTITDGDDKIISEGMILIGNTNTTNKTYNNSNVNKFYNANN